MTEFHDTHPADEAPAQEHTPSGDLAVPDPPQPPAIRRTEEAPREIEIEGHLVPGYELELGPILPQWARRTPPHRRLDARRESRRRSAGADPAR